jgi:hypothetical protein
MKTEFDSTYPIHLNGIISPDEFRVSMDNINRAMATNARLILAVLAVLCYIGGIVLFAAGGITASGKSGFPPLVGVGIGLFILGVLLLSVGCVLVQVRRTNKMRAAIAEESRKYATRLPTPCSWRLHEITNQYEGRNDSSQTFPCVSHNTCC